MTQSLTLHQIKLFSQCPRLFKFLENKTITPESQIVSISIKVAQRACLYTIETEKRVDWKKIIEYIDSYVFATVDFRNQEAFQAARRMAESILYFMSYWYHNIYSINSLIYSNLPIHIQQHGVSIEDFAQFVSSESIPQIIEFGDVHKDTLDLYNDIRVRSIMSYLQKKLDTKKIKYTYYYIGPYGGHTIVGRSSDPMIECTKIENDRADIMLGQIITSIRIGATYPSPTTSCNQCAFRRRCTI